MHALRYIAAAAVLFLAAAAAPPAAAQTFAEAHAAYKRGDYAIAYRGFRRLAEQGNARAQHYLGNMYYNGQGVPQDYVEAAKWYRLAAAQGNARAQFNLGLMHRRAQGVPQDYAEAVKWYRLAAAQGYARAQNNLGLMYEYGRGVPWDFVRAHAWFNLAASRLSAAQKSLRDVAIRNRDRIARRLTTAQLARAQQLAREWQPREGTALRPPADGDR